MKRGNLQNIFESASNINGGKNKSVFSNGNRSNIHSLPLIATHPLDIRNHSTPNIEKIINETPNKKPLIEIESFNFQRKKKDKQLNNITFQKSMDHINFPDSLKQQNDKMSKSNFGKHKNINDMLRKSLSMSQQQISQISVGSHSTFKVEHANNSSINSPFTNFSHSFFSLNESSANFILMTEEERNRYKLLELTKKVNTELEEIMKESFSITPEEQYLEIKSLLMASVDIFTGFLIFEAKEFFNRIWSVIIQSSEAYVLWMRDSNYKNVCNNPMKLLEDKERDIRELSHLVSDLQSQLEREKMDRDYFKDNYNKLAAQNREIRSIGEYIFCFNNEADDAIKELQNARFKKSKGSISSSQVEQGQNNITDAKSPKTNIMFNKKVDFKEENPNNSSIEAHFSHSLSLPAKELVVHDYKPTKAKDELIKKKLFLNRSDIGTDSRDLIKRADKYVSTSNVHLLRNKTTQTDLADLIENEEEPNLPQISLEPKEVSHTNKRIKFYREITTAKFKKNLNYEEEMMSPSIQASSPTIRRSSTNYDQARKKEQAETLDKKISELIKDIEDAKRDEPFLLRLNIGLRNLKSDIEDQSNFSTQELEKMMLKVKISEAERDLEKEEKVKEIRNLEIKHAKLNKLYENLKDKFLNNSESPNGKIQNEGDETSKNNIISLNIPIKPKSSLRKRESLNDSSNNIAPTPLSINSEFKRESHFAAVNSPVLDRASKKRLSFVAPTYDNNTLTPGASNSKIISPRKRSTNLNPNIYATKVRRSMTFGDSLLNILKAEDNHSDNYGQGNEDEENFPDFHKPTASTNKDLLIYTRIFQNSVKSENAIEAFKLLESIKKSEFTPSDEINAASLLKLISSFYTEIIKRGEKNQDPIYVRFYDFLQTRSGGSKYGIESKMIQIVRSCLTNSNITRIRIFLRLLGLSQSCFYEIEFPLFIMMLEKLDDPNSSSNPGLGITLTVDEDCPIPFPRAIDFTSIFFSINEEFNIYLNKEETLGKIKGLKYLDQAKKALVKFDTIAELFLENFKVFYELKFLNYFKAIDIENQQALNLEKFSFIIKNISFIEQRNNPAELRALFEQYADYFDESLGKKLISFAGFCQVCEDHSLLSSQNLQRFYKVLFKEPKNLEELKRNWDVKQDLIKLKSITSKSFTILIKKLVQSLNSYFKLNTDMGLDFVWIRYKLIEQDSQANYLRALTYNLIPEELLLFDQRKIIDTNLK